MIFGFMRIGLFIAAIVYGGIATTPAFSQPELIAQVERLRNQLAIGDYQGRRELTIKLANLIYNETLRVGAETTTAKGHRKLKRLRQKGIGLYREFLSGYKGRYAKPEGETKAVASFHLARLYADNGQTNKATPIWSKLVKMPEYPRLVAESALWLAEIEEGKNPASKKALRYYDQVLELDKKHDTRAYAQYRRAWLLRNMGRFADAIAALKEALYDSKGQVKDEVLKDLIVFYSLSDLSYDKVIAYFYDLEERLSRKDLLPQLVDAYQASGKKVALAATLQELNRRRPSLLFLARQLEEAYGLRNWDLFRTTIDATEKRKLTGISSEDIDKIKKILARLTVQLDAERVTNKEIAGDFIAAVDLFVRLFPSDELAPKMAKGSVMAEEDPESKIQKIKEVLGHKTLKLPEADIWLLKETLVSLYQKLEDHPNAAIAAKDLADTSPKAKDRRRFRFVQASEMYDGGKKSESIPIFQKLAAENANDDIGRKSAMLTIRTLGQNKDYKAALKQSQTWLGRVDRKDTELTKSKEYQAIVEVERHAKFEWAAGLGSTKEALGTFKQFCFKGEFTPQSCDNARSIAVKTKDYDTLIAILTFEKKEDELGQLYESNGYYRKAARYFEDKLAKAEDASTADHLKIALLYEIAAARPEQQAALKRLASKLRAGRFASDAEAQLIYTTFDEAQMFDRKILTLPWNDDQRCEILERLARETGRDRKLTSSLMACERETGDQWAAAMWEKINPLAEKQAKIRFYGKGSERKFKRRLAAVKKLAAEIDKFLPRVGHNSYLQLTSLGEGAYRTLSEEILNSPIPEGTPADLMTQVKAKLTEMALPFDERAQQYAALHAKEAKEKAEPKAKPPVKPQQVDQVALNRLFFKLRNDPMNAKTLTAIHKEYEAKGHKRIAAYFKGRLELLQGNVGH